MFIPQPDKACLRQGDILSTIAFPLLQFSELHVIGELDATSEPANQLPGVKAVSRPHREDPNWITAHWLTRVCFCAVASQCCEVEIRNKRFGINAAAILVARLKAVPAAFRADVDKMASLSGNRDPRDGTQKRVIDYFYVERTRQLADSDWVIDYSQITSVAATEMQTLLSRKLLQMDDITRLKFKIKLAYYLGRATDEEAKSGIVDPWNPPAVAK